MQQMTDPGDAPGDVTWMSYAELGRSRGISSASAKRLSNRRRWRKQAGNDGTTRVAVPAAEAVSRETASGDDPGVVSFNARALAVLEAALDEANKRAEAFQAIAERALAELHGAGERADRLERDLASALAAADHARAEARAAQDAGEELRRERDVEKARGRWARLRQAWRGE